VHAINDFTLHIGSYIDNLICTQYRGFKGQFMLSY
jgi:hypothetical protein